VQEQKIRFTYLTGKLSATLIIPIEIAKKHGLIKASNVIVEETENGILLTKLKNGVIIPIDWVCKFVY
jgi:bifunctional DNA-binding transcriptional regulator/antitoxin component of YhaV-PrlF toxin-antitoxin module